MDRHRHQLDTFGRFAWDPAVAADRAGHPAWGHAAAAVQPARPLSKAQGRAPTLPAWRRLLLRWRSAWTRVREEGQDRQGRGRLPEPARLGR